MPCFGQAPPLHVDVGVGGGGAPLVALGKPKSREQASSQAARLFGAADVWTRKEGGHGLAARGRTRGRLRGHCLCHTSVQVGRFWPLL